jgi:hypothetical protein
MVRTITESLKEYGLYLGRRMRLLANTPIDCPSFDSELSTVNDKDCLGMIEARTQSTTAGTTRENP